MADRLCGLTWLHVAKLTDSNERYRNINTAYKQRKAKLKRCGILSHTPSQTIPSNKQAKNLQFHLSSVLATDLLWSCSVPNETPVVLNGQHVGHRNRGASPATPSCRRKNLQLTNGLLLCSSRPVTDSDKWRNGVIRDAIQSCSSPRGDQESVGSTGTLWFHPVMGVLMSKKQQVEKGSRRGRPTPPPPPRKTKKEEEDEQKEEGGKKAKPSKAQRSSSAPPKEECRANQEAWSRLRDGKGVEPEEMDRTNQLTPPTYVRPKKDARDDQPLEVELDQREQPANEEMCEICEVWTADDLFPCRTCKRVFHDGCLREMGYLRTDALQEMRESAHTATGWSCYYCDNVNLLLTEDEMYCLMDTFKQCRIIPETCLVSDDFLHYKQLLEKDLSDEQEEEALVQFSALDPEKRGSVEWADFLYHESLGVLRKFRTANSLVRLLTAKERDRARAVFVGLDQDQDGLISWREVQRAQQTWFQKHTKESQSCNVSISHVGPISERSPASSISGRSQEKAPIASEKEDNRSTELTIKKQQVNWQKFLKESAIYILAARPNSSALHLRPPV
ncbi:hypothetical protein SKAU_G00356700 [Synaphobranchus kaupii]|uniref:EF-hand domain-containing protein n=1 Tax=Synaphobranchus kaupii TaxID=118154 RepID=A0A9Q1EHE8_SYNKA|nr:hypothetical protein SKAU_G00356700 [Synaphobranchus kaupii]